MNAGEQVGARFDRRAARYDNAWTAWVGQFELQVIRRHIPAGSTVLDYGCGTGRVTLDLLRRGCKVTAYDISPAMAAITRSKARALGLALRCPAEAQELGGHVWPVITCAGVLDYYPDPVPFLRQLRGLLTETGRLIVTAPNAASPLAWLYALGSRRTVPARPQSRRALCAAAAAVNLQVISIEYAFPELAGLGLTMIMDLAKAATPADLRASRSPCRGTARSPGRSG